MNRIIVTGTDTGIGKTVFAAGLTAALGAHYWKPVQAGLEDETDSEIVARLSGQPVLPEGVRLQMPASPHIAAEAEGRVIDPAALTLPALDAPLVVEGAGGVMVPITDDFLFLDLFARWGAPVILCARTALGTINHSLLSLAALRRAGLRVAGIAFVGASEPRVERTITGYGRVAHLGRLGMLDPLTSETLKAGFAGIDLGTIRAVLRDGPP